MKSERRFKFVSAGSVLAVLACIAVLGFSLATAQEKTETAKRATRYKMSQYIKDCVKWCSTNDKDIDAVMMALNSASEAIDAGDTAAAKQKLDEAKQFLQTVKKSNQQCIEKAPVANAKCPMSGKTIARADVPAEWTRMYKGRKIGFCGAACPAAWGKLSDAEKNEKLEKARPQRLREKAEKKGEQLLEKSKKEHPGY